MTVYPSHSPTLEPIQPMHPPKGLDPASYGTAAPAHTLEPSQAEHPPMGLDGRLLRADHRYAVYVVVDTAATDGGIPQPVSLAWGPPWNALQTADDLQAKCTPIIARAIAAGACWEMDVSRRTATAEINVPIDGLPLMAPSTLSTALSNIEAGLAAQGGTHAH